MALAIMPANPLRRRTKSTVSGETGQEALYLRFLSEKQVPVQVKLRDGEVVQGWIEYFDDSMIRLTREGKPNLFIYKGQIRTISEPVRRDESKRRASARKEGNALLPGSTEGKGLLAEPSSADSHDLTTPPLPHLPHLSRLDKESPS